MYQFDLSADSESAGHRSPLSLLLEYICRDVVGNGVIVYSPEGEAVALNHAAARLCKCSEQKSKFASTDLLEHVYSRFEVSNEEGEAISERDHPLALARRQEAFSDYLVQLKDRGSNTSRYLLFSGDPVYDESTKIRYFVMRIQDVTEKKVCEVKLQDESEQLRLLSETIADLLLSEDPLAVLDKVYKRLSDYLDLEVYFHFQVTSDDQRLQLTAYGGLSEKVAESFRYLEFGETVCGTVAENRSPMIVENVQETSGQLTAAIRKLGLTAHICHPLIVRGQLLGTLSFGTRSASTFAPAAIELIRTLSDQMAIALYVTELRNRTRKISNKLVRVEEEERRCIAHELHDELGGELALLKQRLLRCREENDELISRIEQLIRRVRSLCLDLRPTALEEIGLLPALQQFINRVTSDTGIDVHFVSEIQSDEFLSTEQTVVLYRLVQEALTNVARHASTDIACVSIHRDEHEISVHITDEGVGFDEVHLPGSGQSSGLQHMKERIELMNGTFTVNSVPGKGTHVSAVLLVE